MTAITGSSILNDAMTTAMVPAGAAKRFVIGKDGAEAEREDSGDFEAVTDHARVIFGRLLIEIFLGIVFRNDDCEITGWIEEDLIS